jgi:RND family efflux transporter MFP subunit
MKYRRSKKRVLLGFLVLGLCTGFFVVASFRFAEARRERERYEQERAELRVPEPVVARAEALDLPRVRRFVAELRPWMRAEVAAEVTGRVTEVLVEAGQAVEAGQPLVRLDPTLARLEVDLARARYEEARRLLEESEKLLRTQAISRSAYEAQAATVRADQVALERAVEQLERHQIRAPFTGIVNERLVDEGDAVTLHQAVVRLVDLSKLRVELFVPAGELDIFAPGEPLELRLPDYPGRVWQPTVDFVSRAADPVTRLFQVEAVLDNREDALPGGIQGVVSKVTRPFAGLPFIPAAAVQFTGRHSLVWKHLPEGPKLQEIRVGPEVDGFYPVFEGLRVGEQVLIR